MNAETSAAKPGRTRRAVNAFRGKAAPCLTAVAVALAVLLSACGAQQGVTVQPTTADHPSRIVVFGDCRPYAPSPPTLIDRDFPRIVAAMVKRDPSLAIGLGDYIYGQMDDTAAVLKARWDAFRAMERPLAAKMPVLLAIGNYEGVAWDPEATPTSSLHLAAWNQYFSLPSAPGAYQRYYSYDWHSRVHVVVLYTTGEPLGFAGPGAAGNSPQAAWLIDDLSNNQLPWTIVVFHHPMFDPKPGHPWGGSARAERDRLAAFFAAQGVDLVMQGHVHYYRRHMQDGLPYVTQGAGGTRLDPETEVPLDADDAAHYSADGFSEIDFADGFQTAVLFSFKVDGGGRTSLGDKLVLTNNPRR